MTQKQLFAQVRALGLLITKNEDSEYCIRIPGQPRADYFTEDREDALHTARLMAESVRQCAA